MSGQITITSPAPSSKLTTAQAVTADLGLDAPPANIDALIDRASSLVTAFVGRTLGTQSLTETYRLHHRNTWHTVHFPRGTSMTETPLLLSYVPVTAVASITEDGTALTPDTDYEIDAQAGLLWRLNSGYRANWCGGLVVTTYTAGYALPNDPSPTLPSVIEGVCLSLIRQMYFAQAQDPSVIMELVEGVGRTQWAPTRSTSASLDEATKAQLAPYRQLVW